MSISYYMHKQWIQFSRFIFPTPTYYVNGSSLVDGFLRLGSISSREKAAIPAHISYRYSSSFNIVAVLFLAATSNSTSLVPFIPAIVSGLVICFELNSFRCRVDSAAFTNNICCFSLSLAPRVIFLSRISMSFEFVEFVPSLNLLARMVPPILVKLRLRGAFFS